MGTMIWFVGAILGLFGLIALTFGLIRWFSPTRQEKMALIADEWGWILTYLDEDDTTLPEYVSIEGLDELNLAHSLEGTHQSVDFVVFEHRYRLTGQDSLTGATTAAFPLPDGTPSFHIVPSRQARSLPDDRLEELGTHQVTMNYYDNLNEQYELRADDATALRNFLTDDGLDFLDDPENDEWRLDSNGNWLNLWLVEGNWISKPTAFRDTLEQFIGIAERFVPMRNDPNEE